MTFLVGLCHSGDSIAGDNTLPSYFFQAWSLTALGDDSNAITMTQSTYYATNLIMRNMAVAGTHLFSGSNANDLQVIAPTYVDPIIPSGYATPPFVKMRRYIFTTAIGSNDGAVGYNGTTLTYTQYAGHVATACVARKTAGYNVAGICTLLPRNDGTLTEPNRTGYNSLILGSSWQTANGIDFVIDLASQATMGNPANCGNTTYYSDGIHPTAAGHALLAPIYLAGINAAIAALT